jgi:hypothetical protein
LFTAPKSPTEKGHGALECISLKSNPSKGKQRNFRDFGDPGAFDQWVWFVEILQSDIQKIIGAKEGFYGYWTEKLDSAGGSADPCGNNHLAGAGRSGLSLCDGLAGAILDHRNTSRNTEP